MTLHYDQGQYDSYDWQKKAYSDEDLDFGSMSHRSSFHENVSAKISFLYLSLDVSTAGLLRSGRGCA